MHLRQFAGAVLGLAASAEISGIALDVPNTDVVQNGFVVATYNISCTDVTNLTSAFLYPYLDGLQYGAEVGMLNRDETGAVGSALLQLPPTAVGSVQLQLAAHALPQGPTVGRSAPANAVWSNTVQLSISPRVPQRPSWAGPQPPAVANSSGAPLLGMYFETWFTPLNMNWGGGTGIGEAIPSLGRYFSVDTPSIVQQAAWMVRMGVDALVVDWTNNVWGAPTWADRPPNVQELVNATDYHIGVYSQLKSQGWPVPRFVLLLGLDNGPVTPLPALMGELDYIVQAYIDNATVGPDMFVQYEGKPLVVIFDGGGASSNSNISHPSFTIRWMSSQNQETHFNNKGYWSWMDGSITPELTYYNNSAEAITIDPAFFAQGGWTNAALTMGRSGGLTHVQQLAYALQQTVGKDQAPPTFLFTCQWNEFAGSANGASDYYDSYSADLSNDLEPTGPYTCGYPRAGVACGGYGYRPMNIHTMLSAAAHDPSLLDGNVMVSVLSPSVGAYSNYTDGSPGQAGHTIAVSWMVTTFNSSALRAGLPYAVNISLPVTVTLDGVTVANISSGVTSAVIDVDTAGPQGTPLDRLMPHILAVTAQDSAPGAGDSLTAFPLSFDVFDETVPLPSGQRVQASATAWVRLPENAVRPLEGR